MRVGDALFAAVCCVYLATAIAAASTPKVTVHLVPHSHMDTGWCKTVDQHYFGTNYTIQAYGGVRYIYTNVVRALEADKARKFSVTEMAYFARWWDEQTLGMKDRTKALVASGQIDFINGGWCMHDEASTHYSDMIDQMTIGHRFLLEELGAIPVVGWQIDPFGHSATQAALISAKTGFLASYHARVDYRDYNSRAKTKGIEFLWEASPSMPNAVILGGILQRQTYKFPHEFFWDVAVGHGMADAVCDNPALEDGNVAYLVNKAVEYATGDAARVHGTDVMWPMGADFSYADAEYLYQNMERLIKHVNKDGRIEMRFSSPAEYTQRKMAAEPKLPFPKKTDDFFPHADGWADYWTGYYTSRPAFKRFIRSASSFYSAARQIQALAGRPSGPRSALATALALVQHHDSITGTEMQHVAFDFAKRVSAGLRKSEAHTAASISILSGAAPRPFTMCPLMNISVCEATRSMAKNPIHIVVWNALPYPIHRVIEVPVVSNTVGIVLRKGEKSAVTGYGSYNIPDGQMNNYNVETNAMSTMATVGLVLPPMGFATFTLQDTEKKMVPKAANKALTPKASENGDTVVLENDVIAVKFKQGVLTSYTMKSSTSTVDVKLTWCYYKSSRGDRLSRQASGAYIFRPDSDCLPVTPGKAATKLQIVSMDGSPAAVVQQEFNAFIEVRYILEEGASHVSIDFTVGPLPDERDGMEVVARFSSNIKSNADFYTDSNGREMQKRTRFKRSFDPKFSEKNAAANYYPVSTAAYLEDGNHRMAVLVDGGVGCTSLHDGELELMLHRRIHQDDRRGVREPLDEREFTTPYLDCFHGHCGQAHGPALVTKGRLALLIHQHALAAKSFRYLQDVVYAQPQLFFLKGGTAPPTAHYSAMKDNGLPENVQVVTLELLNPTTVLLRLSHQYAKDESERLSGPVTVDIREEVLAKFKATHIVETTLTTNQEIGKEAARGSWAVPPGAATAKYPTESLGGPLNGWSVTLHPMDVRTFLVTVEPHV